MIKKPTGMYGTGYQYPTTTAWPQQIVSAGVDYLSRGAGAVLSNVIPGLPSEVNRAFTGWPTTTALNQWPNGLWQQSAVQLQHRFPAPAPRVQERSLPPPPPAPLPAYRQAAEARDRRAVLGTVTRPNRERREARLITAARDMLTSIFEKVLGELRLPSQIQPRVSAPVAAVPHPPIPRALPSRRVQASGPLSFLGNQQCPSPPPPTICETHVGTEFPVEEDRVLYHPPQGSVESLVGFDPSSPQPLPRIFSSTSEDDLRISEQSPEILVTPLTFAQSSQAAWPDSPDTDLQHSSGLSLPKSPVRCSVTVHKCPVCQHEFTA